MPIRPENRDRYPADWPAIRAAILARCAAWLDGDVERCECIGECGHDHGGRCTEWNGHPATTFRGRVVLTIAHLDHTPENSAESNLRAMCQRCHLAYDREHHAATRRATERAQRLAGGQLTIGEDR